MSVTFGVSLARIGTDDTALAPATTRSHIRGSAPKSTPWLTFGQEIFNSSAAIPATAFSRSAISTNSSCVRPAMLTMIGTPSVERYGMWWATNASSPSLSKPIELSMPAGVSSVRHGLLPMPRFASDRFRNNPAQPRQVD